MDINWKIDNEITTFHIGVIVKFFDGVLFLLSSLVTDSSFHVNSAGVMKIFFYKGLTRNPEIGNTPI